MVAISISIYLLAMIAVSANDEAADAAMKLKQESDRRHHVEMVMAKCLNGEWIMSGEKTALACEKAQEVKL